MKLAKTCNTLNNHYSVANVYREASPILVTMNTIRHNEFCGSCSLTRPPLSYCQAHFKFSTSSVQFELRLSLNPGYYHPPTPTRESRDTATSGLPRVLKFGMEALINQTRLTTELADHQLVSQNYCG